MIEYKYFYIYLTTNNKNGKKYIGLHKTNFLSDGYIGSGRIFLRAVKKHGRESFSKEIIEFCDSEAALKEREVFWIAKYNAKLSRDFYNFSDGGESRKGYPIGKSMRKRIGKSLKKFYRENPNFHKGRNVGKKQSAEALRKREETKIIRMTTNHKKIVVIQKDRTVKYYPSKMDALKSYTTKTTTLNLTKGYFFYDGNMFAAADKYTDINQLFDIFNAYNGLSRVRPISVENIKTKEVTTYPTIKHFCDKNNFSYQSVTTAIYRNRIYRKEYKIA